MSPAAKILRPAWPQDAMQATIQGALESVGGRRHTVFVRGSVLRRSETQGKTLYVYVAACKTKMSSSTDFPFPSLKPFEHGNSKGAFGHSVNTPFIPTIRVGFLHVTKVVEQSIMYGTKITIDVTNGRWSKEMTAEDRAMGCVGRVLVNMKAKEVDVTAWNGLSREEEAGVCERVPRLSSGGVLLLSRETGMNVMPAMPAGAGPFCVIGYYKIVSARPPLVQGGPAVVNILIESSCESKSGPGVRIALWDEGATATECKWLLKLTGDASYEDAGSASRFAPFTRVARIQNVRRIKPKGSIRHETAHNYESMGSTRVTTAAP
jgi:hypothetical protein